MAQMNLSTKENRLKNMKNRLSVAIGATRGRRGMGLEFGVGRCKLFHLQWVNNKALLYSTGNCV